MGFIRFVPKHENYTFEGDLNDQQRFEYKEFIFNSNELVEICHSYDSRLLLEDHPRDERRSITISMKNRYSNINSHNFLIDITDDINSLQYKSFVKNLFDDINSGNPVTIEYDFYHFG
jgi:hypothetical protein